MTDTTDIKSLLEKLNAQTNSYDTVIIRDFEAKQLVAAFEAERQRADALQTERDEFRRRLKLERSILEGADKELAALKSEINWPVAQKVRAALDRAACPDAFMRIAVEACTETLKGEQVPVSMDALRDAVAEMSGGLPMEWEEGYDKGHHAVPFINFNSLHRIVTKFTATQKPFISKEKLCDWLEDNFDIDDSQRDAFAQCFARHCNCIVKKENE